MQGQCTALRHLVAPGPPEVWRQHVSQALSALPVNDAPAQSLRQGISLGLPCSWRQAASALRLPCNSAAPRHRVLATLCCLCPTDSRRTRGRAGAGGGGVCAGEFAALLSPLEHQARRDDGYLALDASPVAVRFNAHLPDSMDEKWRQVVLDVTSSSGLESEAFVADLASWLNTHQPISFSVNGSLELGRKVWERSGVVVFTCGSLEAPALSCQARPQDGECFGELPPRAQLSAHTRFPMLVPTPTASYNACALACAACTALQSRGWALTAFSA